MLLAATSNGLLRAEPGARGKCPECGGVVIAKCGSIVIWHWAHQNITPNCAHSGETEWHLQWKEWALDQGCQVERRVAEGFRADVVTSHGRVVELQTKVLPPEVTAARENAYGKRLVWLFEVSEAEPGDKIRFTKWLGNGARGFHWRHGPKRILACTAPVYLDINGELWHVPKFSVVQNDSPRWGTSERLLGYAFPAAETDLFQVEKTYSFCVNHRSHFCPCVAGWLYKTGGSEKWA